LLAFEDSLSDHNYLKYNLRKSSNNPGNPNNYQSIKYIIRDKNKQLFDQNIVQVLQKKTGIASNERGTKEIDKAISTAITASKNLEHYIDLIEETIKTACRKSFSHLFTNKITTTINQ
jgi:hypothetical protein